jgi:hypothetical protein
MLAMRKELRLLQSVLSLERLTYHFYRNKGYYNDYRYQSPVPPGAFTRSTPAPADTLSLDLPQILVQRRMSLGHTLQDLVNHVGSVLLDVGLDLGELLVGGFID